MVIADARSRWIDSSEKGAEAGSDVVLTLDQTIQYIAEKEMAKAIRDTHAMAGSIIVEDTASGEILAMTNYPNFDPNAKGDTPPEARMNRAVAALYEPGSVFKIVTLAGALEEGITQPDEVMDCQMGAIYVAGHRIRDHKPFGMLTVSQILAKSSDVGAIKLGLRLGAPKLYDYIQTSDSERQRELICPARTVVCCGRLTIGRKFRRLNFNGPGSWRHCDTINFGDEFDCE